MSILTSGWCSAVEDDGRVSVTLLDMNKNRRSMILSVNEREWLRGLMKFDMGRGALVQDAFPTLSEDEREFLLTGIGADEWDEMFSEDEA